MDNLFPFLLVIRGALKMSLLQMIPKFLIVSEELVSPIGLCLCFPLCPETFIEALA